ncbi:hypothetical protein [Bradyrhizobium sp. 76]|uniref:hypothetical protein n=1 Tax=Bradyrhizobium sp. 76 TaxID=2782680 RepID=UPI001FF89381|nr:hypothetical protein [Bradyrhizobium sp. 76]MCK1409527.1 hypothetical protein [Bradyrhizobium sp. 76]
MKAVVVALLAAAICVGSGLAQAQTLNDQAKCAAQARLAFNEIETRTRPEMLKYLNTDISSTFASYLNTRLQRCFIMLERSFTDMNRRLSTQVDLTDAISRHGYAFWTDTGGTMLTCDLSPPGKARVLCASREEFDAFTAKYLE